MPADFLSYGKSKSGLIIIFRNLGTYSLSTTAGAPRASPTAPAKRQLLIRSAVTHYRDHSLCSRCGREIILLITEVGSFSISISSLYGA